MKKKNEEEVKKLSDSEVIEKLKEIARLDMPLEINKQLRYLVNNSNYNLQTLQKQLNFVRKEYNKSQVTDVTDVTDVTNELLKPCVTFVICNSSYLDSLFGDSVLDQIIEVLVRSQKAFTFAEIALKINKSEVQVRNVISKNPQYFGKIKPKGKICYTYLLQMIFSELQEKINRIKEKKELEKQKKEMEEIEIKGLEKLALEFKNFWKICKKDPQQILISKNVIYINFMALAEFNVSIADKLESNPEETISSFELAIEEEGLISNPRIRIFNIPKDKNFNIEELRIKHLKKLISISGRVVTLSDVRPQVVSAKFECPSCGTIISVLQIEKKFREPSRCSCGRKGGFRLISKEMINTARLILEDLQEKTDSPHSKRLNCFLKEDLLNYENMKMYESGIDLNLVGILTEVPIPIPSGGLSTRMELGFEVISAFQAEEELKAEDLTSEEVEEVIKLTSRIDSEGMDCLTDSFAPEIYGHKYIKQGVCLQLASKRNEVGKKLCKNKPNILLIGDPGTSKSKIGEFAVSITAGARRSVGGSASAVGLTGAVVRDDYTGGWRLEPGAAVLARDFYMIDELNNVRDEDKPRLQELLSEHTITFDKATIHTKLKAPAGVLATANPIHGSFKEEEDLVTQFNLSSPIINRFDLIFVIKDQVKESDDEKIAQRMNQREMNDLNVEYDSEFLKRFFVYIKNQPNPIFSKEISQKICKIYAVLRRYKTNTMNINPRVHEAFLHLCKASAKLRLSNEVGEKDIERALEILSHSYFRIPSYNSFKEEITEDVRT